METFCTGDQAVGVGQYYRQRDLVVVLEVELAVQAD
jgi:hypothetical protein